MERLKLNKKAQFTIIAAMLIAIVLIAAVMTTYSAIRYTEFEEQPRILSAIDEINLALKHVLGFTVGYYGSVLRVTGNTTYARELALNYTHSGLEHISDLRPEWSPSFRIITFDLRTNWFSNASYSAGNFFVEYDLAGLGVYNMNYNASCRLDVKVLESTSNGEAHIRVTKDGNDNDVVNLGKQNLKFYRYCYSNLTWEYVSPTEEPSVDEEGNYIVTVPPGIDPSSFVISVEDSRGIIVVASSFSQYVINLDWNSPNATQTPYYVENYFKVVGDSLNFTAQQAADNILDTLTEAAFGTTLVHYYPTHWTGLGSTTWLSGTISDLQSDNGGYMQFSSVIGYSSIGSSSQSIENRIAGSQFTVLASGQVQSITAYIALSSGASNRKVKAAIYTSSHNFVAGTQEQTVNSNGWITFSFSDPKPTLTAGVDYILVVWADSESGDVFIRYDSGSSNQGHQVNRNYGSWPSSLSFTHENRKYSIYCTYSTSGQYACELEFTGTADLQNWTGLTWAIDASSTTSNVNLTLQLYNFAAGGYPTSGDGYITTILNTTDFTMQQIITANPTNFRNRTGYWKLKVTAAKVPSTPFDLKLDMVRFSPEVTNYALEIEEQWTNVNATNPRYDLCIKTGTMSESLKVMVPNSTGGWNEFIHVSQPNMWYNVSVTQYITSPTFTIRFKGGNDTADPTQDSWNIDAVLLKPKPDPSFLLATLEESTIVVELLQNGTIRWLGQALNTTQTLPVPPIPVKAIHVSQTRNGVEEEVPFQVEDWASEYRVPQGLTNNATVFSNRQMIVFLVDVHVSKITIWWDGRDEANQTSLAYNNLYFTKDDPSNNRLDNGKIRLQIINSSNSFNVTSTVIGTGTSSNASFMRINNELSVYGADCAKVIHHGVVRDIIQQEAEWSGGISEFLYVNSFNNMNTQWSFYGSKPYLGNNDNYIYTNANNSVAGWFGFQDLSINSFAGVKIDFECYIASSGDDYFEFQITDGISTYGWYEIRNLPSNFGWRSYDLSSIITSVEQLNNLMVNIRYRQVGDSASIINIRRCRLDTVTCPNVYSNIRITLPANVTYYTYDLRLMFIDSAQSRVITELCPISFTVSPSSPVAMTENGTLSDFPIVTNGTGTFYNYTSGGWTPHHWSQLIAGSRGAGIMFTDSANQMLYVFNSIAGSSVGAIRITESNKNIELLPVASGSVSFTYALDVSWHGAVVTFDGTTPIYRSSDESGLWLLVEYPPTITVTTTG
ncbi:MAG: hypothetical protein QXX34_05775 [Candidatus Bathyarchaeia archaeon]